MGLRYLPSSVSGTVSQGDPEQGGKGKTDLVFHHLTRNRGDSEEKSRPPSQPTSTDFFCPQFSPFLSHPGALSLVYVCLFYLLAL